MYSLDVIVQIIESDLRLSLMFEFDVYRVIVEILRFWQHLENELQRYHCQRIHYIVI